MKNKSSKIIIGILLILVISLAGFIVYDKVLSKDEVVKEEKEETKERAKEIIYDLKYEKEDVKEYYTDGYGQYRFLSDYRIPYINIDSEDVKKVNTELEKIYNDLITQYKEMAKDEYKLSYSKSSYDYTIYNDILSVVVEVELGGTDLPNYTYYSYNIDLNSKKVLTYEELYSKLGCKIANNTFDNSKISKIMSESITIKTRSLFEMANWDFENGKADGMTYEDFLKKNINNYETSVKDNNVVAFIDSKGMLNVVVKLISGDGRLDGTNQIVSVTDDACYNTFIQQ